MFSSPRGRFVLAGLVVVALFLFWLSSGGHSSSGGIIHGRRHHRSIDEFLEQNPETVAEVQQVTEKEMLAAAALLHQMRNRSRLPRRPGPNNHLVQNMILVPCHATYRGSDYTKYRDEQEWALEPFQLGKGLIPAVVEHMKRALALAAKSRGVTSSGSGGRGNLLARDQSAVFFSGGQTRPDASARTEAQSYLDVAVANDFPFARMLVHNDADAPSSSPPAHHRLLFTEEHARDSYENVLFSLCRFYEVFGHFPVHVTIIGFEYKRQRFVDYHRVALRFPQSRFHYIGVDADDQSASGGGPKLNDNRSLQAAKKDMYLCRGNAATRTNRNSNSQGIPYYVTAPIDVVRLLVHCGPRLFSGPLPWNDPNNGAGEE